MMEMSPNHLHFLMCAGHIPNKGSVCNRPEEVSDTVNLGLAGYNRLTRFAPHNCMLVVNSFDVHRKVIL